VIGTTTEVLVFPMPRKLSRNTLSLLSQRDDLMTEIALLRTCAPTAVINKAKTLLTRFWGRANGRSREDILKAARLFVQLGRLQSAMSPAKPSYNTRKAARKRKARKARANRQIQRK
jgi:hypothetical protein